MNLTTYPFNSYRSFLQTLSLIVFFVGFAVAVNAQVFGSISSKWDDSFREWEIEYYLPETAEEELTDPYYGELSLRWILKNDWTVWEYDLNGYSGEIRQKWHNNPELWEVNADNEIITMRTVWPGDLTQWKVSNGRETIFIQSKYKTQVDEWRTRKSDLGYFDVYTEMEGDARDWIIEDGLSDSLSAGFKMALLFTVVFHSSPKI